MRGGLDDALDKLARRDELRRRASGEPTGTPPAVTELVEAVAAVVGRHPELGVSVGVEGAGDPLLLHFFHADGQVQVNAENAAALAPEGAAPRHADFDLDADDPYPATPASAAPASAAPASAAPSAAAPDDFAGTTQRLSQDDQDRYGPATFGPPQQPREQQAGATQARDAQAGDQHYYAESETAERRYGNFDGPSPAPDPRYPQRDPGDSSRDLGARLRDLGMASRGTSYPPHPFAPTPPPPVPPQTSRHAPAAPSQPNRHAPAPPPQPRPPVPPAGDSAGATRRIHPEHIRPPAEPAATERIAPQHRRPVPEQRGMPTPLPQPIPLQVERPEETEMAARRLAALLRDDPSLLDQPPPT